jgi:predicted alpha/beta-hydrolase family hydrolase
MEIVVRGGLHSTDHAGDGRVFDAGVAPRRLGIVFRETAIVAGTGVRLAASVGDPEGETRGVVLFAHGSGSSRHSPRNRQVAAVLHTAGLGTLLLDLLTPEEDAVDMRTGEHRFDVQMLGDRVVAAIDWLREVVESPLGLFGASTGAAAALIAAAARPREVFAVVSRGGRPDLAGDALRLVQAPTLLIVGSRDSTVLEMNESARALMNAETGLEVIPGATHLFEEPGALDEVSRLAVDWFERYLPR